MESPFPLSQSRERMTSISTLFTQRQAAVSKAEDEDAVITGLTRSLNRRLLGLNMERRVTQIVRSNPEIA